MDLGKKGLLSKIKQTRFKGGKEPRWGERGTIFVQGAVSPKEKKGFENEKRKGKKSASGKETMQKKKKKAERKAVGSCERGLPESKVGGLGEEES